MTTQRKRRRLTDLSVKAISLVSLGANQPAKVLLYKSADVPAGDSPATADTPNATASDSEAHKSSASAPSAVGKRKPVDPQEPDSDDETLPNGKKKKKPAKPDVADAPDPVEPDEDDAVTPPKKKSATTESFMDEKDKAVAEAVAKAAEQADLIKTLSDKLAATEAEKKAATELATKTATERDEAKATIAKAERATLLQKTIGEAKDLFKALPGVKFEAFGEDVLALREANPELAKKFEAVLKAASDALANSDLFKTVGNIVKSDVAMTGEQEYEALVAKTMATDKITRDLAVVKVLDTPEGNAAYSKINTFETK